MLFFVDKAKSGESSYVCETSVRWGNQLGGEEGNEWMIECLQIRCGMEW